MTAMKKLSARQERILEFIRSFMRDRQFGPSVREIQQACSISSTSVVDYNLHILQREGHIHNLQPLVSVGGASNLGQLVLQRVSETTGTRESENHIEFGEGAWLRAEAADLDGLDDLQLTFIHPDGAPRRTLEPRSPTIASAILPS